MNKERFELCIRVLEQAKNLDMMNYQRKGQNDYDISPEEVAHTVEELHACGNIACFARYLALTPEWKAAGGSVDEFGAPVFWNRDAGGTGVYAIVAFLECSSRYEARCIHGIAFGCDRAEKYVGASWSDWKPEHVIKLLRGMENKEW